MNIEEFKTELEARLIIEKEYLIQEISSMDHEEKLELLGIFNGKYRDLVRRLANEEGIDLNAPYKPEAPSESETLTYEQIILGKTMSVYDRLSDELYEEITNV
ncbi:hypothetical protein [Chryseobacterium indologenes]|uniref:Uncharacterized protein n=1 Tax=Chryseobacterium indologenes TaxID=253 RepID=A0A0N1KS46_CHRID|nr:hypothetical protein [Chryseobacterium indologenes]KPE49947.1 hypothetical protein AOB46_17325 [Chryseobacterium indologenes]